VVSINIIHAMGMQQTGMHFLPCYRGHRVKFMFPCIAYNLLITTSEWIAAAIQTVKKIDRKTGVTG
jgi:hypothetical protein